MDSLNNIKTIVINLQSMLSQLEVRGINNIAIAYNSLSNIQELMGQIEILEKELKIANVIKDETQ